GADPFIPHGNAFVIGLETGERRRGEKREKLLGNLADSGGRNDLAGERLAIGSVWISRAGIVQSGRRVGQDPLAESHRGYRDAIDIAAEIARALIIAEEERLIAADRTAESKPKLVVDGVRLGLCEHVPRQTR